MALVVERSVAAESVRHQALAACALERYFLQHHAYPPALSALVPELLPAVPADPVDDQPLRYRKTDDGRYMLWSIGFDLKDDGGKVNIEAGAKLSASKLYRSAYKGDWTWQYRPVE